MTHLFPLRVCTKTLDLADLDPGTQLRLLSFPLSIQRRPPKQHKQQVENSSTEKTRRHKEEQRSTQLRVSQLQFHPVPQLLTGIGTPPFHTSHPNLNTNQPVDDQHPPVKLQLSCTLAHLYKHDFLSPSAIDGDGTHLPWPPLPPPNLLAMRPQHHRYNHAGIRLARH